MCVLLTATRSWRVSVSFVKSLAERQSLRTNEVTIMTCGLCVTMFGVRAIAGKNIGLGLNWDWLMRQGGRVLALGRFTFLPMHLLSKWNRPLEDLQFIRRNFFGGVDTLISARMARWHANTLAYIEKSGSSGAISLYLLP